MKFTIQSSKLKVAFIVSFLALFGLCFAQTVSADAITDNALNYLKAKQNAAGQITGGSFSDASPWAAIAFGAYGIPIDSVTNPTTSLQEYLLANHPTTASSAIEWEKWILAITAGGFNPYNFGGVNYVTTLQSSSYYTAHQIGDSNGINDDWFGVMALIASGVDASDTVFTDGVTVIITNQNSDGGWGYAPGADSDSNDTAAAIQALVGAKEYGVANSNLETALAKAKTYLLSTQDSASGGFFYDKMPWSTTPDSNSTAWALMALNVLGMKDATEGVTARNWLLSQQSVSDGGFTALDWGTGTFVSNSTITADGLVALSGKGWVIKIVDPAAFVSTPIVSPTSTPTATPTPANNSSSTSSTGTPTPTPTWTPTPTPTPPTVISAANVSDFFNSLLTPSKMPSENATDTNPQITTSPEQKVLGVSDVSQTANKNPTALLFVKIFAGLGVVFIFIYLAKPFIIQRLKK